MATWDAREWIASLMGLDKADLVVRSVDRYGPLETQVRYERGNEAVARLTVSGPVVPMGVKEGGGHWLVRAQIGSGTVDVHEMELPQVEEIVY
ncbi:hypothetical protein BH24CHL9_BH24CHL9_08630 [soil metagenome]